VNPIFLSWGFAEHNGRGRPIRSRSPQRSIARLSALFTDVLPERVWATAKVWLPRAENAPMKNEQSHNAFLDDPLRAEARALAASIEAIRRACGKSNPRDFTVGTREWEGACLEFAHDLRWALGLEGEATDIPSVDDRSKRRLGYL
jgi:hypothetical protein